MKWVLYLTATKSYYKVVTLKIVSYQCKKRQTDLKIIIAVIDSLISQNLLHNKGGITNQTV